MKKILSIFVHIAMTAVLVFFTCQSQAKTENNSNNNKTAMMVAGGIVVGGGFIGLLAALSNQNGGNNKTTAAPAPQDSSAPNITSISPSAGPLAGSTSVTITGTGFTGATTVKFGNNNAASFTVNSATQITAVSPIGAAGIVDITVTTPNGTSAISAADQFTYTALSIPVITSALTVTAFNGSAFNYQITATNSPTSFNATGLPGSLSIDTVTGIISGTPSEAVNLNITISATNADGAGSAALVVVMPESITPQPETTPQSHAKNTAFAALTAKVKDSNGNPVSGISVTFTAPATGASGLFSNNTNTTTELTDANGIADPGTFTANSISGSYTVTAAVQGVSDANFSLTNTDPV